jgi:hypothetical protein
MAVRNVILGRIHPVPALAAEPLAATKTGVTIFEFERDAPRFIAMNSIARRFEASQDTEIKAEHVHLFAPHDDVQPVRATKDKRLQFGINLPVRDDTIVFTSLATA